MQKGYIFLCSDITEPECLERSLFGGMEKYANRVKGLKEGDTLFLYNYNTKKLHGIFTAITELKENIVPDAWGGEFPWQVMVDRVSKHRPVSREDISRHLILRERIKFDRAGRPTARLDADTATELCKLLKSKQRTITYDDGRRYHTKDGHQVRSKAEQQIDDWLYDHRIVHAYESALPEAKRCDFEIPRPDGSIYIEYWGLNTKAYLKDKKHKQQIYKDHNLKLIELEPKDLKNLNTVLGKALL